jgi:RecA/RadA recombinase
MARDKDSTESKLLNLAKKYKMNLGNDFLDTGYAMLNMVMGGGLPMCKMIEIFSESGYGKTTVVLSICKNLCRNGHKVLYIDAEGSIDQLVESMGFYKEGLVWSPEYPDRPFTIIQTSYFEDIEEILETTIPKFDDKGYPIDSDFRLVVIDSVAMLAPKEYKGDVGEKDGISIASNKPGVIAKLMTAFCKKFNGYKTAYNMSFFFINQLREDLSMSFVKDQNKTTGGKALLYAEDIRLKLVARKGQSEDKKVFTTGAGEQQEIVVGREVGIKAVKNKVTNGGVILPLYIKYGGGVSNIAALKYILPKKTIEKDGKLIPCIEGSGAWKTLNLPSKSIKCNGDKQLLDVIKENAKECFSLIDPEKDFELLVNEENSEDFDDVE